MNVLVKCDSHRARRKMIAALDGEQHTCYFSMQRSCKGGFYRLTEAEAEKVLGITGVSKAREGSDIMQCWAN